MLVPLKSVRSNVFSFETVISLRETPVSNSLLLRMSRPLFVTFSLIAGALTSPSVQADDLWISFPGGPGPGQGKRIVMISGDEEYRSEECLPQLAKILSKSHGFQCTVLFPIEPATGIINPDVNNNIPGLEALKTADLMIIATRFRILPDDQMKHVVDYIESGRPVIGMRTATHAFKFPKQQTYSKYSWDNTDDKTYEQGFRPPGPGRNLDLASWQARIRKHARHFCQGPGRESHSKGNQRRRDLGPDRRLWRAIAAARRQHASGARPDCGWNEVG